MAVQAVAAGVLAVGQPSAGGPREHGREAARPGLDEAGSVRAGVPSALGHEQHPAVGAQIGAASSLGPPAWGLREIDLAWGDAGAVAPDQERERPASLTPRRDDPA